MKREDFVQKAKDLEHEQEVKDLKREMEFMKREFEVREQEIELECKQREITAVAEIKQENVARAARIEELKTRLEEGPYAQLSDILKALVVKLPTLNVSELSVTTKEK